MEHPRRLCLKYKVSGNDMPSLDAYAGWVMPLMGDEFRRTNKERKGLILMKLNNVVRSILKTAVYIMDATAEQVDRTSQRAVEIAHDAKEAVAPSTNYTLRNMLSFAAGIGVGVGAGLLLAPASGAEFRSSISNKVHEIGNTVKGKAETYATGTDLR
jgi:gas vesicle protein